jgi:hypothetical protein
MNASIWATCFKVPAEELDGSLVLTFSSGTVAEELD